METFANLVTFFGLGLLAWGLWIFEPWVCYAVIGFILMSAGGAMSKNLQDQNPRVEL